MVQLVELLRAVRRWRGDIALVSHVPLGTVELAKDYNMQQWISAEAANRDRWRVIRAIQNRAPYRSVIPEGMSGMPNTSMKAAAPKDLVRHIC